MAFCENCGKQLFDETKFCLECGTYVNKTKKCIRNVMYDGEIHKCVNCGEVLSSFITTCPRCGCELRGLKNTSVLTEFVSKMKKIERERPHKEKVKNDKVSNTDAQKIQLIRDFVIPNTKEDLTEFLVFAFSNINERCYNSFSNVNKAQSELSNAWESKFDQAYEKARILFGDDPDFLKIQDIYDKKETRVRREKKKSTFLTIATLLITLLGFTALFVFGYYLI